MSDGYLIPSGRHRVEEIIQRSRFVTTVGRAASPAEAQAFVEAIRGEFPDATHNCWAFAPGPPGDTAQVGMSDDGEPHGTAGRPMLNVLLHGDVGEVVAVVTRYYGGVKLGKGGLGRAYSGGVQRALDGLPTVRKVDRQPVRIRLEYGALEPVRRLLDELDARITAEDFGAEVALEVGVPPAARDRLERGVADLTQGRGRVVAWTDVD